MKLAEMPRRLKADQQCADRKSKNIADRSQIKVADTHHEKVTDDGIEEAPQNIDRGRGKTLARAALRREFGRAVPSCR